MKKLFLFLFVLMTAAHVYSQGNEKKLLRFSRIGDIEKVKKIVNKKIDINYQDKQGNTALLLAIINGKFDVAKLLLKQDAVNVDIQNKDGKTALILAVDHRNVSLVVELLQFKPDLEISDGNTTAYGYAFAYNLEEIKNKLLEQGAKSKLIIFQTAIYQRGISAAYDPDTKTVGMSQAFMSGICGVYNPELKAIEWKQAKKSGVAGVYNPELKIVEWKTSFHKGAAGVYNPELKIIEWKEAFKSGICGVYNPDLKIVEWKTSLHKGVAGAYNPELKVVVWKEAYQRGVTAISTYEYDYENYYGYSFYGDDE